MSRRLRVLIVCLGNICRSPTAEAVLRAKLQAAGLGVAVEVDSAGTYGGHAGSPPDARSQRHARQRGYDLSMLRARPVSEADFEHFDWFLAMDDDNLSDLQQMRPDGARARLRLFAAIEVPDPYVGGAAGFERVLDLVETACDRLVAEFAAATGGARGTS